MEAREIKEKRHRKKGPGSDRWEVAAGWGLGACHSMADLSTVKDSGRKLFTL